MSETRRNLPFDEANGNLSIRPEIVIGFSMLLRHDPRKGHDLRKVAAAQ
jgi:hypothetical protein